MENTIRINEELQDMIAESAKKYIRCEEAARYFCMGKHSLINLAKNAGALYKVRNVMLVKIQVVEDYLENECKVRN